MIKAIDFLNQNTNDAMFKLHGPVNLKLTQTGKIDPNVKPEQHYFSLGKQIYPYLLVNMRSGTTFHRVDGPDSFVRVGGSTIGLGLAMGFCRYRGQHNPTELVESASKGDSSKIDMSVGDIYGGSYQGLGFPSNMIASSFGRLKTHDDRNGVSEADIARSLLTLVAGNALIYSKLFAELQNIKRVVWIGGHMNSLEYM